jgi:hypothetical protein
VTNPFAWQLPFVLGLHFGTRRALGMPTGLRCSPAIAAALLVPTAWCFLVVRGLAPDGEAKRLTLLFADRSTFGPARLVDFLALAWLVAHVAAWRPKLLNWPAVAALGRHALPVFAFHIVVVGIVTAAAAEAKPYAAPDTAAAVLSLWIPAAVAERRRARGRLVAAPA